MIPSLFIVIQLLGYIKLSIQKPNWINLDSIGLLDGNFLIIICTILLNINVIKSKSKEEKNF